MTKAERTQRITAYHNACLAYEAADAAYAAERTLANRDAKQAAWNAREAAFAASGLKPRPTARFASRAGQRQAAERRALATRRTR